jgi:3-hydroxypropanoate dehydrogenase
MASLDQPAIDQLFVKARTFHGWKARAVDDETLRKLYDLVKWAPTCVNGSPVRILFVKSVSEKEKLVSTLLPKNVEKTRTAPVTAIIGMRSCLS